jgi:hypothetical protein
MSISKIIAIVLFGLGTMASSSAQEVGSSLSGDAFEIAVRRFGINHNRQEFRKACENAIANDASYPLPRLYLGILDEADEKWATAIKDLNEFLLLDEDSDLSTKARREVAKLSILIEEDSTPAGKLNRQYRQHLAAADLLFKQGFAREALLETGEASKLMPHRWEAYAVASNLMSSQNKLMDAKHFLTLAQQHIPASERHKLDLLSKQIERQAGASSSSSSKPSSTSAVSIQGEPK